MKSDDQPPVAQGVNELERAEGFETIVNPLPMPPFSRFVERFAERLERSQLGKRLLEELGPEEGVVARQQTEGPPGVPARARHRRHHAQPCGQMSEDGRVIEQGSAPGRRSIGDHFSERLAGADRDAVRYAPFQPDGCAGQARDRADLGELVQGVEVLERIAPREASHRGVSGVLHRQAAARLGA